VVVEIVTFVEQDNNHFYSHSLNLVTQGEDNNKSYNLYNNNNVVEIVAFVVVFSLCY
jgi:hypothetical protein